MKQKMTFLLLLSASFCIKAQSHKLVIQENAKELANSMLESNWETLVDYSYPKIVQMAGGKEQMIKILTDGLKQQKIKYISLDIGEPSDVHRTENNLFSLVPQTIIFSMPNKKIKTESYLLAVSEDNGGNWYFIDTAQLTMDNVKSLLPNYNMDLVIPPWKQPVLLDN